MTDRELLEAAAKAAGYEYIKPVDEYDGSLGLELGNNPMRSRSWNPLTSDADAFRLMVDCCIEVAIYSDAVAAAKKGNLAANEIFHYDVDRHAATRRSIVRAAAGE